MESGGLTGAGHIRLGDGEVNVDLKGTLADVAPLAAQAQGAVAFAVTATGPLSAPDVTANVTSERLTVAAREIVGLDTWDNPRASLRGPIEAIPAPDASFDVVLCAQVLEHVDDPAQGVRELARVTRPGGRVLLSTHGTFVYHPNPVDLWRWTGAGLERLFSENGEWGSVTVSAGSGTASSLAMLNAIYLEHVLRRTPLRPLRGALVSALNRAARALDRRVGLLRDERPGTLAANYHVVADRA